MIEASSLEIIYLNILDYYCYYKTEYLNLISFVLCRYFGKMSELIVEELRASSYRIYSRETTLNGKGHQQ